MTSCEGSSGYVAKSLPVISPRPLGTCSLPHSSGAPFVYDESVRPSPAPAATQL